MAEGPPMNLTLKRVYEIRGDALFCKSAVPALSERPGSFVFKLSTSELEELCRAWLELETRVKCIEAEEATRD